MPDNDDEVKALRAEVAELRQQALHDTETREQLLEATGKILPALDHTVQQWQQRVTGVLEAARHYPEKEKQREEALLPRFAELATRVRACEEEMHNVRALVIEMHTLVTAILAVQRGEAA
jgi:hypothetical protein